MWTVRLHVWVTGTLSVGRTSSVLFDTLERTYVQTFYTDSDVRVRFTPATIDNKFIARKLFLEKHSFLSSLADNRLSSWNECFKDYSWNCNCTQRYLNYAKDRGEQKVHFAPISMTYDCGRYLGHSQAENQDKSFICIPVLMLIHLFSVLNASKHPLMHDMSLPKRLCWKRVYLVN